MGIIDELDKLIKEAPEDEELDTEKDAESIETPEEPEVEDVDDVDDLPTTGEVGDLLKHVESLQNIVKDIDSMVDDQSEDDPAFRAEISIRKAIGALQDLSDKLYKKSK
jgi:hypothetical protein